MLLCLGLVNCLVYHFIFVYYDDNLQRILNVDLALQTNGLLRNEMTEIVFCTGPVLLILSINFIFFAVTISNIHKVTSDIAILNKNENIKL